SEYGVTVVNTPTATSLSVAELTIGLLFTLARSIPHADSSMKNGGWIKKQLCGVELKGKTLGIIGIGNIGSIVAGRAASLRMDVIGYDIYLTDDEMERRDAHPVPLRELYARSDFICLHIPLTAETRGMIDAYALSQMKPGVRLVCTARGDIIDEDALLTSLESGQVAGAALDVYGQEPPGLTALITHPNVVATPHIGAQTAEAQARAAANIADEVLASLRGEPLRWKVG
ncbi:NAD(P)-dependent oxidoreductase, partial [Chloroflexota bacterium]